MNSGSLSLGVIVLLVDLCFEFDFLIVGVGILFDSEEESLVLGVEVLEGSEDLLMIGSGMGFGLGMGSGEDVIFVI